MTGAGGWGMLLMAVSGEQVSSLVVVLQLLWQKLSDGKVILEHLYFFWIGSLYTFLEWVRV